MKKTYITIIIVILVVLGLWFFASSNKEVQAPVLDDSNNMEAMNPDGMTSPDVVNNTGGEMAPSTADDGTTLPEAPLKEFTISGKNFSFTPSSITVNKGDRVKITFESTAGFHDLKIDEFGVATKQMQAPGQEVLEFIADKSGSFEYYCSVGSHRAMGMKGTLIVK